MEGDGGAGGLLLRLLIEDSRVSGIRVSGIRVLGFGSYGSWKLERDEEDEGSADQNIYIYISDK
jgi:hypothetical protein